MLVIFDLDGVLVDACEWHKVALNDALKEVAGFEISEEEHRSTFNGLPTRVKLNMLTQANRLSQDVHDEVYRVKQEKTLKIIDQSSCVSQEKIDMIQRLKREGHSVACFTNSIRETAEAMLNSIGVLDLLDALVSNQDVENPKPDPEGYLYLMRRFSATSDRTVIVEDSQKGLSAAWPTGAQVVKVPLDKENKPIVSEVTYELISPTLSTNFQAHYPDWRKKRIAKLTNLLGGESWFKGKKILELGCGYGHVGRHLQSLGAIVTFAEVREEHIEKVKAFSQDGSKVLKINNEDNWSLNEDFDLVIHWGLLYHLSSWQDDLRRAINHGKIVCLDTVVSDSEEEYVYMKDEEGYDQAFAGKGSNPSPISIEKTLDKLDVSYSRYDCKSIDSGIHEYSWKPGLRKRWHPALRRFWLIRRNFNESS